jgi:hypothetical protein
MTVLIGNSGMIQFYLARPIAAENLDVIYMVTTD